MIYIKTGLKEERIEMNHLTGYAKLLEATRQRNPLIQQITNYVTVNDCANATLAIGASPIMADALEEAADIAAASCALTVNIGTLYGHVIESMVAAGKSANEHGVPVILDPVGAGASDLRNSTVNRMLTQTKVSVLRGNISEIRYISGLASNTKGVDAGEGDSSENAGSIARNLAKKLGCVVAITGEIDAISDGEKTVRISNGHPKMSQITGTGCMCTALIGSIAGAAPNNLFDATVSAILIMGISGEIAYENAGKTGNGAYRMALIDALSLMTPDIIEKRGKLYEEKN